jgi:tRNA modification GTPase
VDATDPAPPLLPDGRTLLVFNKIDLLPGEVRDDIGLAVSCQTGVGLSALVAELGSHAATLVTAGTNPVLTRARHRTAVAEALGSLDRFVAEAGHGAELALLAEDLRLAARAIGSIVGAVGVEDVLDRIFASFCIGK